MGTPYTQVPLQFPAQTPGQTPDNTQVPLNFPAFGGPQQQTQQKNFWSRLMQGLAAPSVQQQAMKPGQSMGQDINGIVRGLSKLFGQGKNPSSASAPTPGLDNSGS